MCIRNLTIVSCILFVCSGAVAAKWEETGQHIKYPRDVFFVAVGVGDNAAWARNAAIGNIEKQITADVTVDEWEKDVIKIVDDVATRSIQIQHMVQVSAAGGLEGVEVVATSHSNNTYFALAVLNKRRFATNTRDLLENKNHVVVENMRRAKEEIARSNLGEALALISAAKSAYRSIPYLRRRLSAITRVPSMKVPGISAAEFQILTEKCISSIHVEKVSGDNQGIEVGQVPNDPFVIRLKAGDNNLRGIWVRLLDEDGDVVEERISGPDGLAVFMPSSTWNDSVGKHEYTTQVRLKVRRKFRRVLDSKNMTFHYKVKSRPCAARIETELDPRLEPRRSEVRKSLLTRLARYGVNESSDALNVLRMALRVDEVTSVSGVSRESSLARVKGTLELAVIENNTTTATFSKRLKGVGNTPSNAIDKALKKVSLKKHIEQLIAALCGGDDKPKPKIAVFRFRNTHGYWWREGEMVTDMITTRLINSRRFEVVERSQLLNLLNERELALEGITDNNDAIEVAKLAGAKFILIGSIGRHEGRLRIDARVIDVTTGVARIAMSADAAHHNFDPRVLANSIVRQLKPTKL